MQRPVAIANGVMNFTLIKAVTKLFEPLRTC
jgi:hypothetical protein